MLFPWLECRVRPAVVAAGCMEHPVAAFPFAWGCVALAPVQPVPVDPGVARRPRGAWWTEVAFGEVARALAWLRETVWLGMWAYLALAGARWRLVTARSRASERRATRRGFRWARSANARRGGGTAGPLRARRLWRASAGGPALRRSPGPCVRLRANSTDRLGTAPRKTAPDYVRTSCSGFRTGTKPESRRLPRRIAESSGRIDHRYALQVE